MDAYECPYCKKVFEVPEELKGQPCRCPHCNGLVSVSRALWKLNAPWRKKAPSGIFGSVLAVVVCGLVVGGIIALTALTAETERAGSQASFDIPPSSSLPEPGNLNSEDIQYLQTLNNLRSASLDVLRLCREYRYRERTDSLETLDEFVLLGSAKLRNISSFEFYVILESFMTVSEDLIRYLGASSYAYPFEYHVLDIEWMTHHWGPQVVVRLETTNDVARKATREDLSTLWNLIGPILGSCRAFVYIQTPVPGAGPWAIISRIQKDDKDLGKMLRQEGEWDLDIRINQLGIDAEPYCFVNRIDRSITNQRAMCVTLPIVNHIHENLAFLGWKVTTREEDIFSAERNEPGEMTSVTLTPESINVHAYSGSVGLTGPSPMPVAFLPTVRLVFSEFGIAEELCERLYSIIGSPEYLHTVAGAPSHWEWKVGQFEIYYIHLPGIDQIDVGYWLP